MCQLIQSETFWIDSIFKKLMKNGATEIGFGPTEELIPELSGKPLSDFFQASAKRFPVKIYSAD